MLNIDIDIEYLLYQYGVTQVNPSVTVHLRNSNKQQLILKKFYTNNTPSVGNETAKFQLNLLDETITTATFVRSPQNTSVSGLF